MRPSVGHDQRGGAGAGAGELWRRSAVERDGGDADGRCCGGDAERAGGGVERGVVARVGVGVGGGGVVGSVRATGGGAGGAT
jgi:hypothetical protein